MLLVSSLIALDSTSSTTQSLKAWELAKADPIQTKLSGSADPITVEKDGYVWNMTPRADYRIAARVLNRQHYEDWQASIVPLDLALGWGDISEPIADKWVDWRQSDRWYFYRIRRQLILRSPFSSDYVREHSANVHIVPATATITQVLARLERNTYVLLEGKLVDLETQTSDGTVHQFNTSLSRVDAGDASCEIMYVEKLTIGGDEYY